MPGPQIVDDIQRSKTPDFEPRIVSATIEGESFDESTINQARTITSWTDQTRSATNSRLWWRSFAK